MIGKRQSGCNDLPARSTKLWGVGSRGSILLHLGRELVVAMRIVLMNDWFLYYTVQLANGLCEANEVMLIVRDHNREICGPGEVISVGDFLSETLDKRVRVDRMRYRRSDLRSFAEMMRIWKNVMRFGPEVIHVQDNSDWRIAFLFLLARKLRRVFTIHDVRSHSGERRGLQNVCRDAQLTHADRIIVHGSFLRQQLLDEHPEFSSRAFAIPHGAYTLYRKWDRGNTLIEPNTVLFFGRISLYKGLDVLISAQPAISAAVPGARIIIAGQGQPLEPYLQGISDPRAFEIHNRFIPHREVAGLFRRAKFVVLPYLEASQSGVVALACAFGKPVVATQVGSLPEVVKHMQTGIVVPPGDPTALAEAIVRLLKDELLLQHLADGAARAADHELAWNNIAKVTVDAYNHGNTR